jgi:hypothetical protein
MIQVYRPSRRDDDASTTTTNDITAKGFSRVCARRESCHSRLVFLCGAPFSRFSGFVPRGARSSGERRRVSHENHDTTRGHESETVSLLVQFVPRDPQHAHARLPPSSSSTSSRVDPESSPSPPRSSSSDT